MGNIKSKKIGTLDYAGAPSAASIGDLDRDGKADLATVVRKSDGSRSLVLAWGDTKYEQRTAMVVTPPTGAPNFPPGYRDVGGHVVAQGDFNGDGRRDVAIDAGIAYGRGGHEFEWTPQSNPPLLGVQPVGVIPGPVHGAADTLVRAVGANVELLNGDRALPLPMPSNVAAERISDLIVADFDGDGKQDVLAGWQTFESKETNAVLWRGADQYSKPAAIRGLPGIDYHAADLDGDGRAEVIAQLPPQISDFPGYTRIATLNPDGSDFTTVQRVRNFHNHNDNADVADVTGDGRPDYVRIGVDDPEVAVLPGQGGFFGPHDPKSPADSGGWQVAAAVTGIGVQVIPFGDHQNIVAVRTAGLNPTVELFELDPPRAKSR